MSKNLAAFEKALQKRQARQERFRRNLEMLRSVPRALESYIAFQGTHREIADVLEKIEHMKYDFTVEDGVISFFSEFSECDWSFDPSARPLGWRTPKEPATIAGVIRT